MFKKITDHIYVRSFEVYSDRPNIGLIVGEKYTLLYDAGNSADHVEKMKEELSQQGLPIPDFVVLSHWHWDHTFGAHAWGIPVIAGCRTNEHLKKVRTWSWDDQSMEERIKNGQDIVFCNEMIKREYPDRSRICVKTADIVFDEHMTIDLGGGIICELIRSRGPHSEDSIICCVPSEQFVFLGDSNGKDLYDKPWHFDIAHEEDADEAIMSIPYDRDRVEQYLTVLDMLDFAICVGGHGGLMTRKELYQSLNTAEKS